MSGHQHTDNSWRVAIAGDTGGAGVLLDAWHVLTCAHLVGDKDRQVTVHSAVARPGWHAAARVVPGSWVYQEGDPLRGDVALLELDRPAACDAFATLWRAPVSGGRVRVHGFPGAARNGIPADAELGGDGGVQGELGFLNPVHGRRQWIEPGFSGAGVLKLDGDHAGHVIGIVVLDYRNAGAKGAWMMPTETILHYLPNVARYAAGVQADQLGAPDDGSPDLNHGDVLRVALTRELARLLTSTWAGTVVLPSSGSTGTAWLLRLVRTADPATRARTSGTGLPEGLPGTVLGFGAVDAAYDARGRSAAEVSRYLVERFGLLPGHRDPIRELPRREPPACIVIDGADRARDPGTLLREVLRPLAVRAASRGVRLVLGFAGPVPEDLPYDVSLDPAPVTGPPPGGVTAAGVESRVEAHVEELAAAEARTASLYARHERRFRLPQRPVVLSPRLRVRLAVTGGAGHDPEITAIDGAAFVALTENTAFQEKLQGMPDRLRHLLHTLDVNFERAKRYFPAEDQELAVLYGEASRALRQTPGKPIDLDAAAILLKRYVAEIDRRIDDLGDASAGEKPNHG
jgi:Trypsin-like peptidase domain